MFVPFESLSNNNKVWIYLSDKAFTESQLPLLNKKLETLCENWQVHGNPLQASYQLVADQMIVLFSDEVENQASGCSIDSSVRALREVSETFGVELFDRWQIAVEVQGIFETMHINDLKKRFKAGEITEGDFIYKTTLGSKKEFLEAAKEPIFESAYYTMLK